MTHAVALHRLLGSSEELIVFDQLHFLLKQKQKGKKDIKYKGSTTLQGTAIKHSGKVLRRRSDLKEEISKLEKCHFTVNNKLPAED